MAVHEIPEVIVFSHDADLTLRVLEYPQPLKPNDDGGDKIKSTTDFQVDRQVLINTSDSEFFRTLLTSNAWAESGKSLVTLKEHNPASVEAILCSVYSKDQTWESSSIGQHTTARTLQLPAENLWDVIASNHLFMIPFADIDAWFSAWYDDNEKATTDEMLLYPCYQFHHARGFMSVTRNLVYDRPFIEEYMSEKHYRFHLPPRLIHSLNAARGHLRVLLASWLWKPLANVLRSSCACKEKSVFEYLHAFTMTGGYPIDQQGRNSVSGVCKSLGSFDNHFKPTRSRYDCYVCGANWSRVVTDAVISIEKHFDGLCLDCMDHTQPKFLDEHEDYWNHVSYDKQWDKHCRIKHGQATWYSSFMGRADTKDRLLKRKREYDSDDA